MTPEFLIGSALCLPLIIAAGIAAFGKFPNLREGVTIAGSVVLFAVVIQLTIMVAHGQRPEHDLEIGGRRVHFGSGGASPNIVDLDTGLYRGATLADGSANPDYRQFGAQVRRRTIEIGTRDSDFTTTLFNFVVGARGGW